MLCWLMPWLAMFRLHNGWSHCTCGLFRVGLETVWIEMQFVIHEQNKPFTCWTKCMLDVRIKTKIASDQKFCVGLEIVWIEMQSVIHEQNKPFTCTSFVWTNCMLDVQIKTKIASDQKFCVGLEIVWIEMQSMIHEENKPFTCTSFVWTNCMLDVQIKTKIASDQKFSFWKFRCIVCWVQIHSCHFTNFQHQRGRILRSCPKSIWDLDITCECGTHGADCRAEISHREVDPGCKGWEPCREDGAVAALYAPARPGHPHAGAKCGCGGPPPQPGQRWHRRVPCSKTDQWHRESRVRPEQSSRFWHRTWDPKWWAWQRVQAIQRETCGELGWASGAVWWCKASICFCARQAWSQFLNFWKV